METHRDSLNHMKNSHGFTFTALWITAIAIYAICKDIKALEPNELGDFLAGACAPIAFFWLILSFRQQSKELELQRHQLELQKEEIKDLAKESRIQSFYKKMEFEEASLELMYNELSKKLAEIRFSGNEDRTKEHFERYQKRYDTGEKLVYWNYLQQALTTDIDPENISKIYMVSDGLNSKMADQYIQRVTELVNESEKLGVKDVMHHRHTVKLCASLISRKQEKSGQTTHKR